MPKETKPRNWPDGFPYVKSPLHAKDLEKSHLTFLRTKPTSLTTITSSQSSLPSSIVKIVPITSPTHPAYQQHGLFATQNLKPGTLIVPYLGRTHTTKTTDPTSDYDIWLDKEADIAVDASKEGNEGRFVNDFRGIREKANAEFGEAWSELWGEIVVCVWVKKGAGKGIRKGEEICVSYGKGFWEERKEGEEKDGEGDS